MRLKCKYFNKEFGDSRSSVVLAAYRAHRRRCGPAREVRYSLRGEGKEAARGRYAGTPELIQRVRMEGCLAYIDGEGRTDNPYDGLNVKRAWLEGWMVAEMAHREGM